MKKISLEEIKSGVLIGKPIAITVQIKLDDQDAEFDTFIKPFSYDTAVAQMRAYGENKESLAGILASCICNENGELEFTEQDVRQHFSQSLVDSLWEKIHEVNIMGKTSNSTTKTKLSAKSPSPQGEVSKKSVRSNTRKSKPGSLTEPSVEASTSDAELSKPLDHL